MNETLLESAVEERIWAPSDDRWYGGLESFGIRLAANAGALCDRFCGSRAKGRFGILMYHRIAEPESGIAKPTINVAPAQFLHQMTELLEQGVEFWPLRDLIHASNQGQAIPSHVTALTFDDAFESFYWNAWPVLERLGIPATVFVNTAFVGQDIPLPFDGWAQDNFGDVDHTSFRPINWRQAHELNRSNLVELGAHTHTHQDFRGRPAEFRRDLQLSVDILRDEFGVEDPAFAFPYGTPRLGFADPTMVAAAKDTGVVCGLTTGSELIRPGSDPFSWGRFNVFPWDDAATISAKLQGWYSWAPRGRRRISEFMKSAGPRRAPVATRSDASTLVHAPSRSETPSLETPRDPAALDTITIVVPTYNRRDWLPGALETLCGQHTDNRFEYDIIVVDNASADDTSEVVRRIAAETETPITYLYQEKAGDAPTRNKGVSYGESRWLAFFDDDQFAAGDWLLQLHTAAVQTGAKVIGGPVLLDITDEEAARIGKIGRRTLREITFYSRLHPYVRNDLPGTGNALVAREVFESIGMFDESMTGGGSDSDLFMRARDAGFQLWYTPRAVIRHRVSQHRLTPEYMRWDALSGGAGHAAHFDYQKKGAAFLALMCLVRLTHAAAVTFPLLAVAHLRRDKGEILGRRTLLWRTEGYVRKTLSVFAPCWFRQQAFFDSLEFRKGREVGV